MANPAKVNLHDVMEDLGQDPTTTIIRVRKTEWSQAEPLKVVEGEELTKEIIEKYLRGGERVDTDFE